MIKGVFIINSTGKPRLLKCYEKLVSAAAALVAERGAPKLPTSALALLLAQTEDQQQAVVREIFSLLSKRSDAVCNFLEGGRCVTPCWLPIYWQPFPTTSRPARLDTCSLSFFGKDTKLIYRHYATLYFVIAVDTAESELGILDLIQVFVEVLDKCFENVCELDLIFHPDKVNYILDEIVMGGMVLETNLGEVLEAVVEMDKLEASTRASSLKA